LGPIFEDAQQAEIRGGERFHRQQKARAPGEPSARVFVAA
jgi:hypothetical protein